MSIRQVSFEDQIDDISTFRRNSGRYSKYAAKKKQQRNAQDNILQQPRKVEAKKPFQKPFIEPKITTAVVEAQNEIKKEEIKVTNKETTPAPASDDVKDIVKAMFNDEITNLSRTTSEELFRRLVGNNTLWFCEKEVFYKEMKKDLHPDFFALIDVFYESRPGFLENIKKAYEIDEVEEWIDYRLKGEGNPEGYENTKEDFMRAYGFTTQEQLESKFKEDKELLSNAYASYLLEQQVAAVKQYATLKQKKKVVSESTTKKDSIMSNPKKVKKMTSQVETIEAKDVIMAPTTNKTEIQSKKGQKKMSKKAAPAVELSDEENTLVDTIVSRVQKNQRQETERVRSIVSSESSVYTVVTTSIIAGFGIYAGFKTAEYVTKKVSEYLAEKAVGAVVG